MSGGFSWAAAGVFGLFVALAAGLGLARRGQGDFKTIEDWGLAGRKFGTLITWFLIGGDFYTAYTLLAVPALVYGTGAYGFFALVFTVLVYPMLFLAGPRLWRVAHRHKLVTLADFVEACYGSRALGTAVAVTGILALLPYMALQLLGMQVAIGALGLSSTAGPLVAAFVLLAAWTWFGGLHAPARVAFLKDAMVYTFVLVAIIWIPSQLGGYGAVFRKAGALLAARATPGHLILPPAQHLAFATLALGSGLAAFLYPNLAASVLSASSARVIQRNAVLLPAYTFLLGLVALLGFMALAAGVHVSNTNQTVTALLGRMLPPWFAGFCFAAIVVGGLVPAAIMAIAAASLFIRNVWRRGPNGDGSGETRAAKWVALGISLCALAFVLFGQPAFMINLQLLGGIWILQTLPAVGLGLYRQRLHPAGLLVGWAAGMVTGTAMAWTRGIVVVYPLHLGGLTLSGYAGIYALMLNFLLAGGLTPLLRRLRVREGRDATMAEDYEEVAGPVSAVV